MTGRLNHITIAVANPQAAAERYRDTLDAKITPPQDKPKHGVTVVFIKLFNTKIESLTPLGDHSPVTSFLEKSPTGGIHHTCYEVDNILSARDRMKRRSARVLENGGPKAGAHGKPVLFLHPKDFNGCLIESEQA